MPSISCKAEKQVYDAYVILASNVPQNTAVTPSSWEGQIPIY